MNHPYLKAFIAAVLATAILLAATASFFNTYGAVGEGVIIVAASVLYIYAAKQLRLLEDGVAIFALGLLLGGFFVTFIPNEDIYYLIVTIAFVEAIWKILAAPSKPAQYIALSPWRSTQILEVLQLATLTGVFFYLNSAMEAGDIFSLVFLPGVLFFYLYSFFILPAIYIIALIIRSIFTRKKQSSNSLHPKYRKTLIIPMIHTYFEQLSESELEATLTNYFQGLPEDHSEVKLLRLVTQEDLPIPQAIRSHLDRYSKKAKELDEQLPMLLQRFNQWIEENNISVSQTVNSHTPAYLYDSILQLAFPTLPVQNSGWNQYLNPYSHLLLTIWSTEPSIFSEMAKVASYNEADQLAGYTHLQESPDFVTVSPESNQWFNLGVTTLTASKLASPESMQQYLDEQRSVQWHLWLVQRIQKELKLLDEVLIQGYFAPGSQREEVEQAVQQRFNHSLSELRDFYPLPQTEEVRQKVEDILSGKAVTLSYPANNRDLEHSYHAIAQLFPNVTATEE